MTRMLQKTGVLGVAAPQFDVPIRVCVVRRPQDVRGLLGGQAPQHEPLVLLNPAIQRHSEDFTLQMEGCISVPGLCGPVRRFSEVSVAYTDPQGRRLHLTAPGLAARIVQHELDHLDGILFTDRVPSPEDLVPIDRLEWGAIVL